MRRRWSSFNQGVTDREVLKLPYLDRKKLFRAMYFYGKGDASKCVVQDYGDGLLSIKDTARGQGRCLFFAKVSERAAGGEVVERLVALLFYKKESQEVPENVLDTARARLREVR